MSSQTHAKQYFAETFCILLALTPLIFIPVTQNYFDTNKWVLLILVSLSMFFLWLISSIRSSSVTISVSPATAGFSAVAAASLISLFIASTNKADALLNPLGPVTWVALALITIFTPTLIGKETDKNVRWALYGSSATVALISLYEAFGVGKIMFPSGSFLADPLFTPTGTTTASAGLFAILLPLTIWDASEASRERHETSLAFLIIIALIEAVGLGVTLWQLIPNIGANFLPFSTAWSVMLETLKNTRQSFVGVGAENFVNAFTAGRPLALNMTPIWNARFLISSNLLFHLMTVYGLLGGAAAVLLGKGMVIKGKPPFTISLIMGLVTFLLLPPTITVLIICALLVALIPGQKTVSFKLKHRLLIGIPALIIVSAISIGTIYYMGRAYWADILISRSFVFAQQNNGTQTYNLQVQAVGVLPQVTNYHIYLSQTTMSIATTLAASLTGDQSANTNLKNDQQLIAQLIQQSIRDAKLAISINPKNIFAWENIARLYSQLVGVAQGADNWSTTAYNQAIGMDPTNASLRLELGMFFVRLQNYTAAITEFQQAIALKSNYTNAYYNLSNAYKLNKDITRAITTMEQTVSLVDKNSGDYKIATQALADLKKSAPGAPTTSKLIQNPTGGTSILTTPTPAAFITPTIVVPNLQVK